MYVCGGGWVNAVVEIQQKQLFNEQVEHFWSYTQFHNPSSEMCHLLSISWSTTLMWNLRWFSLPWIADCMYLIRVLAVHLFKQIHFHYVYSVPAWCTSVKICTLTFVHTWTTSAFSSCRHTHTQTHKVGHLDVCEPVHPCLCVRVYLHSCGFLFSSPHGPFCVLMALDSVESLEQKSLSLNYRCYFKTWGQVNSYWCMDEAETE